MSRLHSTYHAVCLCGKAVESATRETTCEWCGRLLVFEWGGDLSAPAIVRLSRPETNGGETKKATVVIVGGKQKAKGASA